MRKSSVQLVTQTSEPLIVVDESSEVQPDADHVSDASSASSESPTTHFQKQFLLSPWRDARETRKLSLPSPQCSGITASQVRRLSERSETAGPGPRQTEFLATLSQAPAPTPGGRRHSVVTISKVPSALFGRGRRESMMGPRGSVHNLQLDIMDDIVASRRVRMKMWTTSSEKVCELKDADTGAVRKYTSGGAGVSSAQRRYSDFVGTTLAPIPSSSSRRRVSELPSAPTLERKPPPGIVCSNTDLVSMFTSPAMPMPQAPLLPAPSISRAERRKSSDACRAHASHPQDTREHKVMWDENSGSVVDAQVLGTAIEDFLRRDSQQSLLEGQSAVVVKPKGWFGDGEMPVAGGQSEEVDAESATCDSTLCATLKDLFVK